MKALLQQQWSALQNKAFQTWDTKLAPRYEALEEREQKIVRLAAIVLPIILFVFGIFLPVFDKNKALQAEITALAIQVQEANQLADLLASSPQLTNKSNANILSQVDTLARQTGVRTFMTRLRPQQLLGGGQSLQAQIKDAPYSKVADFLALLEKNGLPIDQLKIESSSEGQVHMQAVIGG